MWYSTDSWRLHSSNWNNRRIYCICFMVLFSISSKSEENTKLIVFFFLLKWTVFHYNNNHWYIRKVLDIKHFRVNRIIRQILRHTRNMLKVVAAAVMMTLSMATMTTNWIQPIIVAAPTTEHCRWTDASMEYMEIQSKEDFKYIFYAGFVWGSCTAFAKEWIQIDLLIWMWIKIKMHLIEINI